MANRPIRFWAVTLPDYHHSKYVGQRADWLTIRLLKRDAIQAFKDLYPPEKRQAIWERYVGEYGARVERVVVTVEESAKKGGAK